MSNMNVIDREHIQTPYGIFGDVSGYEVYPDGNLRSVRLFGQNVLLTHAGELIPAYRETTRRKYKPSVTFYAGGSVKAVALDEISDVMTPIGEFPAELVTFYESGEIRRVFPTDARLDAFGGEEEEGELLIPMIFDLGFVSFRAKISGISFYRSGAIESITLFPGEEIEVPTPVGVIPVRIGISLYESGALRSLEPARAFPLATPIGKIFAYDAAAVGICADDNALAFRESGELLSVRTTENVIFAQNKAGVARWYKPLEAVLPEDEAREIRRALTVRFEDAAVMFNEEDQAYSIEDSYFTITKNTTGKIGCSPSDCASCSLCSKS